MFFGEVETDAGEILNIMDSEGQIGGKPILIFWTELDLFCADKNTENSMWFKRAEKLLSQDFCSFCQPLLDSLCDGEWNYHEGDYDLYLMRAGEPKMTPDEFSKYVNKMDSSWVDIQPLINCIEFLVRVLKASPESENHSYISSSSTLKDFEALYDTLLLLAKRKAWQVRIRIL
jgi:hypothetical protein